MKPLQGIRVIELGQYIAAPYCAMMLADQGAEVIKIERPEGGDPRRDYDPLVRGESGQLSGGFLSYNRNKASVTLDLTQDEDRQRYMALAETADAIVENLRPGVVDKLGVGYASLALRNPRLVYAAISGYGRSAQRRGPYSDRPAFDTAIQAMAGILDVTGEAGGPPVASVTGLCDIFAGVHAAFGVLTALHARDATGHGTFVDISMYDAAASLMERELMLWEFDREERLRGLDAYAPVGTLNAADGHVALILPTDEIWRRLCQAVSREDLLDRSELLTVKSRSLHFATVIRPEIGKWTSGKTRREIVEHFSASGVPVGEVQSVREVFECPHLEARGMFVNIDDPVAGTRRMIRTPLWLDNHDAPTFKTAPQLGANNDLIPAAFGVPAAQSI